MNNIQKLIEAEKARSDYESDRDREMQKYGIDNYLDHRDLLLSYVSNASKNATPEIKELVELCRAYFHEGSDSLTREDIERIEQRIRELVE